MSTNLDREELRLTLTEANDGLIDLGQIVSRWNRPRIIGGKRYY